jgi:hypothetical protein
MLEGRAVELGGVLEVGAFQQGPVLVRTKFGPSPLLRPESGREPVVHLPTFKLRDVSYLFEIIVLSSNFMGKGGPGRVERAPRSPLQHALQITATPRGSRCRGRQQEVWCRPGTRGFEGEIETHRGACLGILAWRDGKIVRYSACPMGSVEAAK